MDEIIWTCFGRVPTRPLLTTDSPDVDCGYKPAIGWLLQSAFSSSLLSLCWIFQKPLTLRGRATTSEQAIHTLNWTRLLTIWAQSSWGCTHVLALLDWIWLGTSAQRSRDVHFHDNRATCLKVCLLLMMHLSWVVFKWEFRQEAVNTLPRCSATEEWWLTKLRYSV